MARSTRLVMLISMARSNRLVILIKDIRSTRLVILIKNNYILHGVGNASFYLLYSTPVTWGRKGFLLRVTYLGSETLPYACNILSSHADQEYIYFMSSETSPSLRCKLQETLPSACYILYNESSIPFYSTSNGCEKYLPKFLYNLVCCLTAIKFQE